MIKGSAKLAAHTGAADRDCLRDHPRPRRKDLALISRRGHLDFKHT